MGGEKCGRRGRRQTHLLHQDVGHCSVQDAREPRHLVATGQLLNHLVGGVPE